jgi:hypothetical protein
MVGEDQIPLFDRPLIQRILIRGGVFVDPRRSRPPDNAELRHNHSYGRHPLRDAIRKRLDSRPSWMTGA